MRLLQSTLWRALNNSINDFGDINVPDLFFSETIYPDLYRFIMDNLEKATSQEEADKIAF